MMSDKVSDMLFGVLQATYAYLEPKYEGDDLKKIKTDLLSLSGIKSFDFDLFSGKNYSYESIQETLSTLNENENIRKSKGVYYTPNDVVRFIIKNSIRSVFGKLGTDGIYTMDLNDIPYLSFCNTKLVLDPTCGAGEFLLCVLDIKFDLLDDHLKKISEKEIQKVVSTIFGNDTNSESTTISKIRLYLCAVQRYGLHKCRGIVRTLNNNFTNKDFVSKTPRSKRKFDLIIGNPPFIEDSKCNLKLSKRYGNIYANVLKNSAVLLNNRGALGFVIPLSYISTPRMKTIREELFADIPEQYILSYADRPDSLFRSVHQKLCIFIGKKRKSSRRVFTSDYRYWYKEERDALFDKTEIVKNIFISDEYIPKLGTASDVEIYKKIRSIKGNTKLIHLQTEGNESVYVNMRAAFWIKAFRHIHSGSEYKQFTFQNAGMADYFLCLINSSLFWWYWICVSDCWHITGKELQGFAVPSIKDFTSASRLATALENKLEETKLYVGTKQTEYEYKHKSCVDEIHAIDDYINGLYGLTDAESQYIKNFAYRYRISGGTE